LIVQGIETATSKSHLQYMYMYHMIAATWVFCDKN